MTEWTEGRAGAIGWREVGDGPAVVVLHGAMQAGMAQRDLALALAERFRVVLPDRRGRGLSDGFAADWSPAAEVADAQGVLAATGATRAVGISSGALILLDVARAGKLERLALFEPPLRSGDGAWADQVAAELARGDEAAALVTGMRAAEMGPGWVRRMPRPVLERMTKAMMDRRSPDVPTFRELAPTLPYDGRLAAAADLDSYREVTVPTLLIGTEHSPRYLRDAVAALGRTLPDVRTVTLPGVAHGATANADLRGAPAAVAAELLGFL